DIIKLSQFNINITEIDLSMTKLSDDSIKYIFLTNFKIKKIFFPNNTNDISLYFLGLYNHNSEVISIRNSNISDNGIYYLSKFNNHIKYIDISNNNMITNKSIKYLKKYQLISINCFNTRI